MSGNNLVKEKLDLLYKKLNRVLDTGSSEVSGYGTTFTWNGGPVFDPFNAGISMEDAEKVRKLVLGPLVKQVASVPIPISQGLYQRAYKSDRLTLGADTPASSSGYFYGRYVTEFKTGYLDLVFPNIEELEIQADDFKGVTNAELTVATYPPNGTSDEYYRKWKDIDSGVQAEPIKEKGGILSDLFFNKTYFMTNVNKGLISIQSWDYYNFNKNQILLLFPYSNSAVPERITSSYARTPEVYYGGNANGLPLDLINFKTLTLKNLKTIKVKRWIFFNMENHSSSLKANGGNRWSNRPFGPFIGDFKGDVTIETTDVGSSVLTYHNGFPWSIPPEASGIASSATSFKVSEGAYPHFGYTEPYDVLATNAKTMTIKFKYDDNAHRRTVFGENAIYNYDKTIYPTADSFPFIPSGDKTNQANMVMSAYMLGFGKFIVDYTEFPGSRFVLRDFTTDIANNLGTIVVFRPAQLLKESFTHDYQIFGLNATTTASDIYPEYNGTGGWVDWVKNLNISFDTFSGSTAVTVTFNGQRDAVKPYATAKIILPNQITVLPRYAFSGAGGFVTEFNWPTSLTHIENECFNNIAIEHLNIPSTVTRMELYQPLCSNLGIGHVKEITIPNSVTTHLSPQGTSGLLPFFMCDGIGKSDNGNSSNGETFSYRRVVKNGVFQYNTTTITGLQTFNYYAQYQLGDRQNLGANYFTTMPLVVNSYTLTTVNILNGFDIGRTGFRNCPNISVASLLDIISKLRNRTGLSVKEFEIGPFNLAKLTPEQIAVATNKNWTLY